MHTGMDARAEVVLNDFALVTTYLPILGLTLRSSLLISVLFWCIHTVKLHSQAVLMLTSSLVYVDALFLGSRFDRACGHLCLCALAVLTQQHERLCSDARSVVLLINDLLWSVLASSEVVCSTTVANQQLPQHVKLVLGCVFASTHVISNCAVVGFLEMLARGVLYYVLCSLIVLCAPFCPNPDRGGKGVLHLCAPILFVHLYALLGSVLVIVGMHSRLIYCTVSDKAPQTIPKASLRAKAPLKTSQTPLQSGADPDLVAQLQAAKRAHGMA
jgi:hypothetical protein